jgi:hypothetical protein
MGGNLCDLCNTDVQLRAISRGFSAGDFAKLNSLAMNRQATTILRDESQVIRQIVCDTFLNAYGV